MGRKFVKFLFFLLSLFALALLAIFPSNAIFRKDTEGFFTVDKSAAPRSGEEENIINIYNQAKKAVVFISTLTLTVDPYDIFTGVKAQKGAGTGFVINGKEGIVITNLHVIEDAHKIEILMFDGSSHKAKLLGLDQEYDIAVLKIVNPPNGLQGLAFGDSSLLEVGQRVLAIGNPHGLYQTLTTGVVSSLNRSIRNANNFIMKGLIQTDAAINPGNSGGPLLDSKGRVIGINSAILSSSGDWAGIGFAIPSNQVIKILPELIATGKYSRPKMGWILIDTPMGVMVRRVFAGGPADLAGVSPIERAVSTVFVQGYVRDFKRADLIYKVNGKVVKSAEEVEDIILSSPRGKAIQFEFWRGGDKNKAWSAKITPILK